jgi:hypothetical protein
MNMLVIARGGERTNRTNKRLLVLFVTSLILAMLATPVFAQGPEMAVGKNRNVTTELVPGVSLLTPSGIDIDWVLYAGPVPMHIVWKDARYFKINNAFIVTDAHQVIGMGHTWLYLSQQMFYDLMLLKNVPPYYAAILASFVPDGTYMISVELGN